LIQRHHVKDDLTVSPPAERSVFACIFSETNGPEPFTELSVLAIGSDFGNCIHIDRRADTWHSFVRD
jgi:hypothetical protein